MGRSLGIVLAVVAAGSAIFLGVLLASPSHSGPPPGAVELRPGISVPRHLKAQVTEVFVIRLQEHEFLRVVVEQQGIDVVVSLLDPGGRELFTTDRLNQDSGLEPIEIVATASGWHSLRVRSLNPAASGRYTVRIEELRRADAGDEERERASRAFARGEALWGAEDPAARKEYQAALQDWRTARHVRGVADAQARLGGIADASDALEEARRAYREAAELYGQLGDREEISLLIEVGKLSRLLSDPARAEAAYLRALRLARRGGERSLEGEALNNLGVLYDSEAKPGQALKAYDQALEIWTSLGDRAQEASTRHNLGTSYSVLGRLPQALEVLNQALQLRRKAGDQRGEAATLNAIAWALSLEGRHAESLDFYDKSIRLRRLVEDRIGEAVTLDRRATTLAQMGRPAEALEGYEQALGIIQQQGGELRHRAPALANLGTLYVNTGDLQRGEQLLQEALPLLRQSADWHGVAHVFLGLADAARERQDIDLALQYAEEANGLVESLRSEAPGPDLRLSYMALRYGYRELWIDILMDLHARQPGAEWDQQALEASERGRARGLLENRGQDATLRTLEIRKLESLLLQPLEEGIPPEQVDRVEKKLSVLLLERDRRRAEQPASPAAPRRPILQEVRELLGPDTLLLEYAVGEERSFLWLLGADGLETRILPGRAELETQVLGARTHLSSGYRRVSQKPSQAALATLGRTLIGPVADRLGDKRLLIVPDGMLHEVPFSALTVEPGGDLVLAGHELALAPSASAVVRIRQDLAHRRPLPGDLALLADPVFTADDARVQPGTSLRAKGPRSWKRLPHTKSEADAIVELLPPSAKWVAALGFEANREAVLGGLLNGHRVVHFATHADLNPEQPELSSLVLTLVDPSGHSREGYLRSYEIRELNLPADLVVLSACSTGLGRELRGEGPLGLSRSFLEAGAARVLVSLWDVEDKATAELMRRFYRALLADHLSPAAALRQAQLSMLQEPRWASPYYWAGFVLQGEWR